MRNIKDHWLSLEYLKFEEYRTRPGIELINRVEKYLKVKNKNKSNPYYNVNDVCDLGCGSGFFILPLLNTFSSIKTLKAIDNSENMLQTAKKTVFTKSEIFNKVNFECISINNWLSNKNEMDLIYSNSVLQWIPNHEKLFKNIFNNLKKGGIAAIQIPNNFNQPSHKIIKEILYKFIEQEKINNNILEKIENNCPSINEDGCKYYYNLSKKYCDYVDCWQTEYFHELQQIINPNNNNHPVCNWLMGSYLGPIMSILPQSIHNEFLNLYNEELNNYYKTNESINNGEKVLNCLFPFKRIFIVAVKN